MLADTYRGLASGKPDCDRADSRSSSNQDFISVPVYFAQPVNMVKEERQAHSVIGKRVATVIMMAIAMAIAMTLVWHVTESDASLEWRRTQHSPAGPDVGVIAHASHAAEPRLNDHEPRARPRLPDVHDTIDQDHIEPPKEPSKIRRRARRQQPVEPGFVEASERRAAHHLEVDSQPILRVYRATEHDQVEHPKLYEHPVEPPSVEELLRPWKIDDLAD
jgi:hypothetical protein